MTDNVFILEEYRRRRKQRNAEQLYGMVPIVQASPPTMRAAIIAWVDSTSSTANGLTKEMLDASVKNLLDQGYREFP